ncbi:hypothetical protein [Psychroserpens sp. SPM9]|uniref:hypothetical protein n=1 Tax=Psychroserpens sp. SPM9 TaxID=2975598 RepID=UPI0021A29C4E|nr:hypothetical protein [Psychroserpens sp. SPM9]MDG5490653.1 hypothetical protein [Psychroserpens sp. SPM9]
MKTKKKTYILLVLVLGVWGTFTYKLISGLNPDLPELNSQLPVAAKEFKLDTKIDAFSISTVDKDPFLGTVLKKKRSKVIKSKQKTIAWRTIEYLGIVKGKNRKENVFIVSVDGKQCLFKSGESRDSMTLLYGNKNRVTLRYKNNNKTFSKKG